EAANASLEAGVIVVGRVVGTPAEVVANPYYRERGTLAVFSDPTYGDLLLQMPFQKASASPPRPKWACRRPGQANAHVYAGILGAALRRPSGADVAPGRPADHGRAGSQVIREKPRRPGQHLERPQVRRALCLGERSPVPVVVLVDEPLEVPPELRPLGERAR